MGKLERQVARKARQAARRGYRAWWDQQADTINNQSTAGERLALAVDILTRRVSRNAPEVRNVCIGLAIGLIALALWKVAELLAFGIAVCGVAT